jgi:hypothetical protein
MKTIQMMAGGTGMGGAKEMAEMLRRMGRNGDTMLAHITPEEAELLADLGGAGTENPETGLPEFYPYDLLATPGGEFYETGVQSRSRPRTVEIDESPVVEYIRPKNERPVDMGDPESRTYYMPDSAPYFTGDPRMATTTRPRSVYERLTGRERSPDMEQTSPQPAAYKAAIGMRRFDQADPYAAALSGRIYPDVNFGYVPDMQPLRDQTAALQRPEEPGFATRAETRLKEIEDVLNQYPRLTRAGTAGAGILAQALLFNRANRAMTRDIEETRRAAEPFRAAQAEAMGRATGAGLTPEQEQDLEIAQARARQGLGERGLQTGSAASGVLAAQQRRARSLARQEGFQEALRLANIADQYDQRALQIELQRDQQLGQLFASIVGREVQQAQRETAPAAPAAPTAM